MCSTLFAEWVYADENHPTGHQASGKPGLVGSTSFMDQERSCVHRAAEPFDSAGVGSYWYLRHARAQ